ncbi:MAG: hypothetical protein HYV36_06530 [Lentisphaerae bacterium]|nr:hypothetical protein [Lentisphaerota bacterium]
MSLIQDALKRQQQEAEGPGQESAPDAAVPESMPAPPSTEQLSPPAAASELERPRKSGKQIALIIFSCLLIVWGSFFLAGLYLKHALLGLLQPSLQQSSPLGESFQIPAEPPEPVITPAGAPVISPAAASAPALAGEGADAKEDSAGLAGQEPSLPAVAPLPSGVVWPRLKLTAVFSNVGSGQAAARLNNRLVLLGDKIEGVTLVEIRSDGVMLKSGSAVRFLKMGATLH